MKIIKKYSISLGKHIVGMDKGAQILSVEVQNNQPTVSVLTNTDSPLGSHMFLVVQENDKFMLNESYTYIGSFSFHPGRTTYYVFDCGDTSP
jgi:hypothetical protein